MCIFVYYVYCWSKIYLNPTLPIANRSVGCICCLCHLLCSPPHFVQIVHLLSVAQCAVHWAVELYVPGRKIDTYSRLWARHREAMSIKSLHGPLHQDEIAVLQVGVSCLSRLAIFDCEGTRARQFCIATIHISLFCQTKRSPHFDNPFQQSTSQQVAC